MSENEKKEARVGLVLREEPEGHLTLFIEGEMTAGRPMLKAIGLVEESERDNPLGVENVIDGAADSIAYRFQELMGEDQ